MYVVETSYLQQKVFKRCANDLGFLELHHVLVIKGRTAYAYIYNFIRVNETLLHHQ